MTHNKTKTISSTPNDTKYPSEKAVYNAIVGHNSAEDAHSDMGWLTSGDEEAAAPVLIDADTLGGYDADYFLDKIEESQDVDLTGYATEEYVNSVLANLDGGDFELFYDFTIDEDNITTISRDLNDLKEMIVYITCPTWTDSSQTNKTWQFSIPDTDANPWAVCAGSLTYKQHISLYYRVHGGRAFWSSYASINTYSNANVALNQSAAANGLNAVNSIKGVSIGVYQNTIPKGTIVKIYGIKGRGGGQVVGPSTIELDKTLSIENKAADAKAVGDSLAKKIGYAPQTLTAEQKLQARINIDAMGNGISTHNNEVEYYHSENYTIQTTNVQRVGRICLFCLQIVVNTKIDSTYGFTLAALPFNTSMRIWINNGTQFYIDAGTNGIRVNNSTIATGGYKLSGFYFISE